MLAWYSSFFTKESLGGKEKPDFDLLDDDYDRAEGKHED
jgi:hypothetical protein